MNRDRIAAELPPDMATWLHAYASDDTWESLGRDLAVTIGTRLLAGDPGTNPLLFDVHQTASSPAVRHVAATLGYGRRWSAYRVTREIIKYLELYSAQYQVERSLCKSNGPPGFARG